MDRKSSSHTRRGVVGAIGAMATAGAFGLAGAAQARAFRIISITSSRRLPVMRADTPVPADPGLIFHFQLSTTPNTVIYAARFDAAGNLDTREPVSIYWRRYAAGGDTRALNFPERQLAYGLILRQASSQREIPFSFRAVPDYPLVLRQIAPFEAGFFGQHEGREMRLIYGYLEVIDGLIPQVPELRMFGAVSSGLFAEVVIAPRG